MARKIIPGTDEAEVLVGGAADERIEALAGDDVIVAGGGNDTLRGGDGDDVLAGEKGNDWLVGDRGNDVMLGGEGHDTMVWNNGDGSDVMEGGEGYDRAIANGSETAGDEFVIAGNGDRVNFQRVNFGQFSLDIGGTETLIVNGLGGDDIVDARGLGAGLIDLKVFGGDGNDNLTGSEGDDYLNGGAGNDVLVGFRGNDTMLGGTGNDTMIWNNGDGSDIMEGGQGYDRAIANGADTAGDEFVIASNGARVDFQRVNLGPFSLDIGSTELLIVNGQGGDDSVDASGLEAGLIDLKVFGGDGNDNLTGSEGDDYLNGGAGNDVLVGFRGNDTMLGAAGNDTMIWNNGDGSDIMEGGDGYDRAIANGADTAGDEFVIASNGARVDFQRVNLGPFSLDIGSTELLTVNGQGGDDSIDASGLEAGSIKLKAYGGDGNDTLIGGAGDDYLSGGSGNDELEGERGNDVMLGGAGHDTMEWDNGDGSDVMDGGTGFDTAKVEGAETDGDVFEVSDAAGGVLFERTNLGQFTLDISNTEVLDVNGLGGDDTIDASDLSAGSIKLKASGGAGNDTLIGGDGNDYLNGGADNDLLTGGDGADTFVFNFGHDNITDFQDGIDVIRLAVDGGFDSWQGVQAIASQQANDVVFDFGQGNVLTLEDTLLGDIDQSDFLF